MRTLAVAAFLCLAGTYATALSAESVSLVNLISNPEKYDGKKVIVSGYLSLDFEGSAIYLHKDDYENTITTNGVWCVADLVKYKEFDHSYVSIEAVFDAKNHGHLNLFAGELKEISRVWACVKSRKQGTP